MVCRKEVSLGGKNVPEGSKSQGLYLVEGYAITIMLKGEKMKKNFLVLLILGMMMLFTWSASEAQVFFVDSPFTSSYVEVLPNFDGFGNTAILTYESTDNLGSYFAFLVNPAGIPIATPVTGGWVYLFADTLSNGNLALYGSDTGFSNDWTPIF